MLWVFCLQIHARAKYTVNEKKTENYRKSIENFEFIVHSASGCICKQNTNLTVSITHLIPYNLSLLLVLASKSRKLLLTKYKSKKKCDLRMISKKMRF